MNNDQDNEDKPHEASPQKLKKMREKGEIPRSKDLLSTLALASLLLVLWLFGAPLLEKTGIYLTVLFSQIEVILRHPNTPLSRQSLQGPLSKILAQISPALLLPFLLICLYILVQGPPFFVVKKISPQLKRISLLGNFKQKYGADGLFEFTKSAAKLAIFSLILGGSFIANLPRISQLPLLDARLSMAIMGQLILEFLTLLLIVSLPISLLDFFWQRRKHFQKHRMSQKDLKEEHKDSEGDPVFKQARRQKAYEIAMGGLNSAVAGSSVIVVNPQHYAVALKWARQAGTAPTCAAKGIDHKAQKMRKIAAQNRVPIYHDPKTARRLYAGLDIGQEIDPADYEAIAQAIRFADAILGHEQIDET
jgi:flagellar biosynthesis protein FlhB